MRVLPFIVAIGLAVYAIIDLAQTDPSRVKWFNRILWAAVIVIIPLAGPAFWLLSGKIRDTQGPTPRRERPRPLAPDDDPEFLRRLKDRDNGHEKMLGDWESDLRRREEELRRRGEGKGDDDSRP